MKLIWTVVNRISDDAEFLLLAILVSVTIYLLALPNSSETQMHRTLEIAAEHAAICEKLGMKRQTDKYDQCLLNIGQFRQNVERRLIDIVY